MAYSPDGTRLTAASYEMIRLWDVDVASWEKRACCQAHRNLTQEEWEAYMGRDVPYRRTCPTARAWRRR